MFREDATDCRQLNVREDARLPGTQCREMPTDCRLLMFARMPTNAGSTSFAKTLRIAGKLYGL